MRLNFFLLLIAIGFVSQSYAQVNVLELPGNDSSTYRFFPYFLNKKNLWGYADSKGKVLIKPQFREVQGFFKGIAVAKGDKGWGVIDEKGKWLIEPVYDTITYQIWVDMLTLEKDGKSIGKYIVDGKLVDEAPPDYDDGGVVFEEPVSEGSWGEPQSHRETRRFFYEPNKEWRLGIFIVTPGKKDSLFYSYAYNFTFTEPVKDTYEWNVAYTKSTDGKKSGLIAWHKTEWRVATVDPTYDSIWAFVLANPTFYGSKGGKVAIINFDSYGKTFTESPPQFDEVKNWSTVYYVVRVGNEWFRLKHYGFWLPSQRSVKTTIDPEFIIRDIDDILPATDPSYYVYRKGNLLGVLFNRNAVNASDQKDDWFRIDAKFTDVKLREYWFQHSTHYPADNLFDVVLPGGKKGPMTTTGVLLFK